MRDDDQRAGIARQPFLEPDDRVQVEVVGRFVEQHQVGRRHQRLRQGQPHLPAAREARNRIVELRGLEAQAEQQRLGARPGGIRIVVGQFRVQFAGGVAVVGSLGLLEVGLELAQFTVAVDHELGGTALAVRRVLGHVRDTPVRRDEDIAGIGQQFPEQQRDEGRLAAAVVADQPDMLAGGDLHGCIGDEQLGAAAKGEVLEADHPPIIARRAGNIDARLRGCTRLPARSTQRGGGRWRSW